MKRNGRCANNDYSMRGKDKKNLKRTIIKKKLDDKTCQHVDGKI